MKPCTIAAGGELHGLTSTAAGGDRNGGSPAMLLLLLPMPPPRRTPGLLLALLLVALLWRTKSSSDFHMTVPLCSPGGPTVAGLTGRV
jgi:hypothetical protein